MNAEDLDGRPAKRRTDDARAAGSPDVASIAVPVSPPRKRQRPDDKAEGVEVEEVKIKVEAGAAVGADNSQDSGISGSSGSSGEGDKTGATRPRLRSPFQLTAARGVPARDNVDTVTVQDVFGDPRIEECWNFNFCYDLPFMLSAFAQPQTVRLHIVHGYWLQGSGVRSRKELEAQARAVTKPDSFGAQHLYLHNAYLPEAYGTHHTKMAIFFRSDATAQVVIHTANMIPHDWDNMTQAVWRSPLLPLLTKEAADAEAAGEAAGDAAGAAIGRRFKRDLLNYLRAYDHPLPFCRPLEEQLAQYDFTAVRAVLIGSVPGSHDVSDLSILPTEQASSRVPIKYTYWGWAAMKHALQSVPVRLPAQAPEPMAEVVVQMSSIATIGPTDTWLRSTLFAALSEGKKTADRKHLPRPRFRIVFPTADEIRRSVVGYESGPSIHARGKTYNDKKQLKFLHPMLCHWANDCENGGHVKSLGPQGDARRSRIMPHIKTYVRFSSGGDGSIDWALLTSANLSRQAWGSAATPLGMMQIQSYELGVLVWPELLAEGASMKPVFQKDTLDEEPGIDGSGDGSSNNPPVVPLRMPYSLPLQAYGHDEMPWIASIEHKEPDWRGQHWRVDW